jgi:hypothetical protein
VPGKFNLSGRLFGGAAGRAEPGPAAGQKPSINHEGKETNRLAAAGSMRRRSNRQSKQMENFIGRRERAPTAELSASR